MRGVARAGAALARSGALRSAAGRGLDLVTQVSDSAAEAIRLRRDPALIAERRRVAARRRLVAWSLLALVLAALSVTDLLAALGGDVSATSIGVLVLMVGLLAYAVIGVARSGIDLRARTLVVRRLPAPQPRRRAGTASIRPLINRLDGYSDALRQVVGAVGLDATAQSAAAMRTLRSETLAAADDAESGLRGRAAELTAMMHAGTPAAGTPQAATCRRLRAEIAAGVEEYGRLVDAAYQAAAASRDLASSAAVPSAMSRATDQLTALAAGMRDLTAQSRTAG